MHHRHENLKLNQGSPVLSLFVDDSVVVTFGDNELFAHQTKTDL